MPEAMRRAVRTDWADANKPGHIADSFLEEPSFDRAGNLYLTDIPHGRILRVTPALEWQEVAQTGGWPNGLALHRDGSLWVTDYRLGILRIDIDTGRIETVLGHRDSESFKGVNDLITNNVPSPNGIALSTDERFLFVSVTRANAVWRGPLLGKAITNVAFRPGTSTLVITDSDSGTVLSAELPVAGAPIYSHG